MKTLTESINSSLISEAIEASVGVRIPVMYLSTSNSGSNSNMWQFGYLVFYMGGMDNTTLKMDFAADGSDNGRWSNPDWIKDIFVKFEDFDPTFEKLSNNKTKAIKEISKWAKNNPYNWEGFKIK